MTSERLLALLGELEASELPLLSWGVTTGSLAEDELLNLLEKFDPSVDPEDLLDELERSGLVFGQGMIRTQYRTRMAETVRLAASLRQWFHGRDWRNAPSLVSDLRFLSRARSVPRRELSVDSAVSRLAGRLADDWRPEHERVVRAIFGNRHASEFQLEAAEGLLARAGRRGGTCIAAGTGAGKTLAFYVPALAHMVANPRPVGVPRVVAIYPRVELLRDQLRACLETIAALDESDAGQINVGVLYGATPDGRDDARRNPRRQWKTREGALVAPFLKCLRDGCDGELVWPETDKRGRLLRCVKCSADVTRLVFTRNELQSQPPEILFTTTEMVNRNLGDTRRRKLFVGDARRSPDFVLLDEMHTYSSTHGAQVANLIRRWLAAMEDPGHVVGLSATLADPAGFFSELIGAEAGNVHVVRPAEDQMQEAGREYLLALRGDPASQTALLSTTIQVTMLLRRMLDHSPGQPSSGAFGSRVFVFTDHLDVVNRLYSQLTDAEGWTANGVDRKARGSLALLRSSEGADGGRYDEGQMWSAAEALKTLDKLVRVGRTTSQDSGVDQDSDVVVATASLEVGFDDPEVGAVIQHKAPRDGAQFLQRRGRAGRDPSMRPWTAVVLSDYGRDRLAFESYEALFDPRLESVRLPLRNRVILKMQATWWLLDHLSMACGGVAIRNLLKHGPSASKASQAERVLREARDLLKPERIEQMGRELGRALRLDDVEVQAVLWDHPRAIVTTVLPTIIRRLQAALHPAGDTHGRQGTDPMNDFLPQALFSKLQTPEVQLRRREENGESSEVDTVPIAQAMREHAPGRVSYRYALRGRFQRLWVKPPPPAERSLAVEDFCDDWLEVGDAPGVKHVIVQPREIALVAPAGNTPDTAYGRWHWKVAFQAHGTPAVLDMPEGNQWAQHVTRVEAHTHRGRSPLTVWRYGCTFEVERRDATQVAPTEHSVTVDGSDAAVGFAMDVDAVRVRLRLPSEMPHGGDLGLDRALRTAYFEHLVCTDPAIIAGAPSVFLRKWLVQLAVSAVVTASAGGGPAELRLPQAQQLRSSMAEAARSVFGAVYAPEYSDSDDESAAGWTENGTDSVDNAPRLVADVESALDDAELLARLCQHLAALARPVPATALTWVQGRFASTVAAGLIEAMQATCPDLDVEDLRPDLDLESGRADEPIAEITISEDQPGGTGVIEAVVDRINEDPRSFWAVVSSILGPSEGERVDSNLRLFLEERRRGGFREEIGSVRSADGLRSVTEAWARLRSALFAHGIDVDQSTLGALATRLLRPGSDEAVERLCTDLLERWDRLESDLGIEIELRVFAFLAAQQRNVRVALAAIVTGGSDGDDWAVGQLVGLLWPRGGRLRSASLAAYSPYAELPSTERLLVEHLVVVPPPAVDFDEESWRDRLDGHLRKLGAAVVHCADDQGASQTIGQLMAAPTVVGVLEFYPRVVGVERSAAGVRLMVDLREAQQ
ncbi:protein DpdJ [Candidatus Poriferisodalis sp.]|uniref:protein DpdJ n=1 Tax=Candidatus Poriferisodalis sp. TaxID=3101277 RepID=UPI003B021683